MGKKKLKTIILVAVLVIAGAGAGWWRFSLATSSGKEVREAEEIEIVAESVAGPVFIDFDPLIIPVFREGKVIHHLALDITFEIDDDEFRQENQIKVKKSILPLRDAILSAMHAIYSLRFIQEQGYSLVHIKKRLFDASERVLGPGVVQSLLIRSFNKRSLPNA